MVNPFATEIEIKIMSLLQSTPGIYGLEIVRQSRGKLKRGTVYVSLARLEERGLVRCKVQRNAEHPGLPRALYSLTETGEKVLSAWRLVHSRGQHK
jgi:DNA-binding PadR family transcriptional regulator